ncbi:MAG: dockerin type I repeat-containing protein [Clostridia bacterium]|nr:dockerin type I repeat-containing protein [Clostridia bacterium]
MKKVISVLLAIIMAFSCVIVACAEDEISWEEIKMGGKRGDVNADGKISAVDALMVLKYVAGTQELTEKQMLRANMNKDTAGNVSAIDARQILQVAAGLTPS